MFEKDAEEYYNGQYDAWLEGEEGYALEEEVEQAFKDGAEFGYNKANEWRKDIPSNDNDILCQIAKDEFEVGYYHTEKKRFYTIGGEEIEVIQWQEIIPPKFEETEG